MKQLVGIFAILALLVSCSGEDIVAPPEPCNTSFSVDSLQIEVWHLYLEDYDTWHWFVLASYWYEINDYKGCIESHEFIFPETGDTLRWINHYIPLNCAPTEGRFYFGGGPSTQNDLFTGYDSLTVYFTLKGQFQLCCGGLDSLETITWSDTVRVEVIDP